MVSLLSYPFFKETPCVDNGQLVQDSEGLLVADDDNLNVFEDLDALESGEAREFIPYNYLLPSKDWWLCKIKRKNFVEFSMHLEPSNGKMVENKFIFSAKRVGDDFYISQYEYFGSETPAEEVPKGRYCAILKCRKEVQQHNTQSQKKKEPTKTWELVPASLGHHQSSIPPLAILTHTIIPQAECKAEIRTVDIQLPDYHFGEEEDVSELNSKYKNFNNENIVSEKIDVNNHMYVWDLNPQHSNNKQAKLQHSGGLTADLISMRNQRLSSSSSSLNSSNLSRSVSDTSSIKSNSSTSSPLSSPSKLYRMVSEDAGRSQIQQQNYQMKKTLLPITVSSQVPQWDSQRGSLSMRFLRNRVKETSSKNYVFFKSEEVRKGLKWKAGVNVHLHNAIVQFGKYSENVYTLDFRNPVAPLQAFALALSAFPRNPNQL